MKLKLENYKEQIQDWPQEGHHLMAQYDDERLACTSLTGKPSGNLP